MNATIPYTVSLSIFNVSPAENSDDVFGGKKGTCNMFATVSSNSETGSCQPEHFDQENIVPCDSYVYEKSQMTETLATILNLVCEEDSKNSLFGVAIMAGNLCTVLTIYYYITWPCKVHTVHAICNQNLMQLFHANVQLCN